MGEAKGGIPFSHKTKLYVLQVSVIFNCYFTKQRTTCILNFLILKM